MAILGVFLLGPGWLTASELEVKNSLGMTLRLLPAGRFERGENDTGPVFSKDHVDFNSAEDDRPVHPVVLTRPFYLAAAEVTVGQFRKFVAGAGYKTTAEQSKLGAVGWDPQPPAGQPQHIGTFRDGGGFHWLNPGFAQTDDHPVVGVSFADAQAFCAWLSEQEKTKYRLPTEAEWEYAARAGTTTHFSFGDKYRGQIHQFANIGNVELEKAFPDRVRRQWLIDVKSDPADQHVFTAPVGSYRANPWGLYDLYGNVWEWCEDRYLDTAYTAFNRPGYQEVRKRAIDPLNLEKASSDGDWRVIRGGSWFNAPIQCRSSVRGFFEAEDAASYLGFRVVREAPIETVAAAGAQFEQSEAARETLAKLIGGMREVRDGRLTLRVQPAHFSEEFFKALAALDEPVDLYVEAHQGPFQAADIARLAGIKKLAGFLFNGIGPASTDDDFAALAEHPELEQLQITGNSKLTDNLLRHLRRLSQLELLHLDGEKITDVGLQTLPPQPHLKTLFLSGTDSEGLCVEKFLDSPLERFSCRHLTDDAALPLSRFSRLRELQLAGSPLSGEGLQQVFRLSRVNRLDLNGCRNIPDVAMVGLGQLKNLHSVSLTETAAGDRAIAGLAKLNQLREIRLGSDQISDAGVRQLCSLVSLETLGIDERATGLTDDAFSDLWRLVNLHHLELSAGGITGRGFASIHELPRLESLSLQGPDTTDLALKYAARSSSLKRLVIGNGRTGGPAGVTDAGLLALGESKNLQQLDLVRRTTQVSDSALEKLRTQRPDLKINVR